MPSWYPTKKNPLSGSFFREQAKVLAENFNIFVLIYDKETVGFLSLIKKIIFKQINSFKFDKCDPLLPVLYVSHTVFFIKGVMGKILKKIGFLAFINKKLFLSNKKYLKRKIIDVVNAYPDLIYAVTAQANAAEAAEFAHVFDVPYVVSEHCPFPLLGNVIALETKKAIENASAFLSISNDKTRQILMQNIDIHPYLVGNMIDEDMFYPSQKKRTKDHVFTIVMVASFNFYKDYPTFFSTIRYLKTITKKKFNVTVIGFNPMSEINIWNLGTDRFISLFNSYGISEICKLVPRLDRDKMNAEYNNSDVFVMTSIQEGFPVSCLEAAACGLPIYSTRCGGVEDFVDKNIGVLVNLRDYKTLANELKRLIEGKVQYNSELIRKCVVEKYGKEAFKNKLTTIFNSVINDYNNQ